MTEEQSRPHGSTRLALGATAVGTGPAPATRVGRPPQGDPPPAATPRTTDPRGDAAMRRGPRRARLTVKRLDPWTVAKVTFVFALATLVAIVVAVAVLYLVLDTMGVFDSVDAAIRDLTSTGESVGIASMFSLKVVVGWTAVVGAANVLLITALATLGAFLYNLCADLVGGIEVTLSERE